MLSIILFILIIFSGCTRSNINYNQELPQITIPEITINQTPEQKNIQICEDILKQYHSTHTYIGKDIYVCGDMAEDVWNMVVTKGMNAEIKVGNINQDINDIRNANHAWVVAEISHNNWLALEPTGGYIVYYRDNPRYYTGWDFKNPKDFREYLDLMKLYNEQVQKYNQAITEYRYLVEIYNQSDNNTKWAMVSQVTAKLEICNARARDIDETVNKINNLLNKN